MDDKTIAAIATPLGPGGIGIIRISGTGAYNILKRLFVRGAQRISKKNTPDSNSNFQTHRVYYGHIRDLKNRMIIDEVLVIFMKGPKSFTREDVVEIHSHSGYVVLDRLLSAVVDAGAHLAEPGAFIKRAFLNGRIDLTQVEAVIDLINAPCETALQMASKQVAGGLRDAIIRLSSTLYELRAKVEAAIDFADEIDGANYIEDVRERFQTTILDDISGLIQKHREAAIFRDGVLLAIAGIPNVGKSSLLNRLVERETAIVSEMPGTTRDVIREYCSIQGVPVVICDTAGIHQTDDPIETIGIRKAREQINRADVVLLVVEATRALNAFEASLIEETNPKKTIVVINKADICVESVMSVLKSRLSKLRHISVSAKHGTGIDNLKKLIFKDLVSGRPVEDAQRVAPNLRQRKILECAKKMITDYLGEKDNSPELASEALKNVIGLLEDIVGKRNQEALYDDIFSQFCIGK